MTISRQTVLFILATALILVIWEPSFMFDEHTKKALPFGTDPVQETLFPFWLVLLAVGIVSSIES